MKVSSIILCSNSSYYYCLQNFRGRADGLAEKDGDTKCLLVCMHLHIYTPYTYNLVYLCICILIGRFICDQIILTI